MCENLRTLPLRNEDRGTKTVSNVRCHCFDEMCWSEAKAISQLSILILFRRGYTFSDLTEYKKWAMISDLYEIPIPR